MKRGRFIDEQIIAISKDKQAWIPTVEVCHPHGISPATFYKWKSKYDGLEVFEAKRFRPLGDNVYCQRRNVILIVGRSRLPGKPCCQNLAQDTILHRQWLRRMIRLVISLSFCQPASLLIGDGTRIARASQIRMTSE